MKNRTLHFLRLCVIGILAASTAAFTGCATTGSQAQADSATGAAIGAVAGGLFGYGLSDVATGAAIGGGLGYIAGNEKDKEAAQIQHQQEIAALKKAHVSADSATAYRSPTTNPFVGSVWQVVSYVSDDPLPDYATILVSFPTSSKLTTLWMMRDGTSLTTSESYRIVDDVMIVTGNDYMLNAKYSVEAGQLIVVAQDTRIVLQEIEEQV